MYPIDPTCTCSTCATFSRAYLNHLFRVGEILAATLVSVHNIAWFHQFTAKMREHIEAGTFESFRREAHTIWPAEAPRKGHVTPEDHEG
jgi:queuine tRNA-ribosyltransferase